MIRIKIMGRKHIRANITKSALNRKLVTGWIRFSRLMVSPVSTFIFFAIGSTSRQISALDLSTLRTIAFAVRMVIQPTTDWNRDAAAVLPMLTDEEFSI